MRILIDIRLLASGKFSGIEEYTRHLVNNILAMDRENEYSLFFNSFRKQPIADFGIDMSRAPLKRFYVPNKLFDASIRFFGFPKLDRLTGADLIFSPHFNIVAHTEKSKRVMTVHDLSFVRHPEFFSRRKRFWHWLQDYRRQIREADRIIAVSDSTKRDAVELIGVPEEKVTRIYSGVDPTLRRLPPDDLRLIEYKKNLIIKQHAMFGGLGLSRGSDLRGGQKFEYPYILYLGAFEPRKNVVAVIQAFSFLKEDARFKDYELVIAGSTGWLYEEIFSEIKKSSVRERVHIVGQVSPEDRLYLYNGASVFVYPSFFEGFGFPPLEAQACGVPVIASNRSSLPEILGGSAVLVDPWRIDDIVVSLKEFIMNNSFRETFIARGLSNASRFRWKDAAQQTVNVFRNV